MNKQIWRQLFVKKVQKYLNVLLYKVLASASGPCGATVGQICVWDLQQMTCKEVLQHHKFDVVRLAYSRDDRFLISMGIYHLSASEAERLCEPVYRNSDMYSKANFVFNK